MKYILKHTDKHGSYFRGLSSQGSLCWLPWRGDAEKYELWQVVDLIKHFGTELKLGERLEMEAVDY